MRDGAVNFSEERGPSSSRSRTKQWREMVGHSAAALGQLLILLQTTDSLVSDDMKTYISGNSAKSAKRRGEFQTRNYQCLKTYENVLTLSNRGIQIEKWLHINCFLYDWHLQSWGTLNPEPWTPLERALPLNDVRRLWGFEAQSSYVAQACLKLPV